MFKHILSSSGVLKVTVKYNPFGNYYEFLYNGEVIDRCDNNDQEYRETVSQLREEGYLVF